MEDRSVLDPCCYLRLVRFLRVETNEPAFPFTRFETELVRRDFQDATRQTRSISKARRKRFDCFVLSLHLRERIRRNEGFIAHVRDILPSATLGFFLHPNVLLASVIT